MKVSKDDLPFLKWSLGAFLLSLALAGGLISLSEHFLAQSLKDRETAQKQLTDARTQLVAAQSDQENMAAYALEYNSLLGQKVIGNEQRLDWLEGLDKLRQQNIVLDFKYTISPQQPYAPKPALDAGNFQLNRSNMTLQIDLLHEEQLLQLFSKMKQQLSGWFMLDGCSISRTDPTDDLAPLKADCTGGWFTMKNRNAP
ncbi:hypothetical protein [Sideroxydans lithotrophicus]|uniref:Uncharacterized protein n=1 Tax=Sideroxydans lithotrophicus (strain ES-1) TaxID=580332 RepID=D5CNK8_SIDLE|nr:hypothetical protein [Sideroxydans lithotrophicus]ADE10921.1 hypothetical protein Slit_0682 [Sideroxydans lithotrophicus ES-1]